jgi:hypothetical protein
MPITEGENLSPIDLITTIIYWTVIAAIIAAALYVAIDYLREFWEWLRDVLDR